MHVSIDWNSGDDEFNNFIREERKKEAERNTPSHYEKITDILLFVGLLAAAVGFYIIKLIR